MFTVCGGGVVRLGMVRARTTSAGWPLWEYTMARFACIRAEVEKRRAEAAMDRNDKIPILDIVSLLTVSVPRDHLTHPQLRHRIVCNGTLKIERSHSRYSPVLKNKYKAV
jgi:hypothetical protein